MEEDEAVAPLLLTLRATPKSASFTCFDLVVATCYNERGLEDSEIIQCAVRQLAGRGIIHTCIKRERGDGRKRTVPSLLVRMLAPLMSRCSTPVAISYTNGVGEGAERPKNESLLHKAPTQTNPFHRALLTLLVQILEAPQRLDDVHGHQRLGQRAEAAAHAGEGALCMCTCMCWRWG